MPSITFKPAESPVPCTEGETVFAVAQRAGVAIETACVGKGTCGLCRVKIIDGADHLEPFNELEEKHLGNVYYITKVRLSCQCVVTGGSVVVEPAPKRRRPKKR